ncbi:alpha/beta fold hydrolase [Ornithinimicrobium tianjinense]|uniref:Acyl-CoA synthetase n=1 Tax=Ornithinimicrobium tianjinense TaxID=1195761 RepID=A0A917F1I0_9MICO|nr:alpha/beta fold hydrolase [Ornithinimicrobium tianjinense]GGF39030.1 acyl-CoA synthetase [Ornithinimicrobium tianjinense]
MSDVRGPARQHVHGPAGVSTQDAAGLPAPGVPGLDPRWSRVVDAPDADGVRRGWHVLDTGPLLAERGEAVVATLLCVHGNPTWSYLWRRVLAQAPPGWRVVAVDQLGMGFSTRPAVPRTLAQRVDDLDGITEALALEGPVFTLAHDWGGPVSLGWALRHRERLAGIVLTNTAVHQPADSAPPALIRLARTPALLDQVCRRSPLFVRATTALSLPPLPREVRAGFAAPYLTSGRRAAVADFVRDIPFEDDHPSRAALERIAEGVRELEVPALLVWGPRDPVFGERYLADLVERLPQADVQRYADASHLVLEDRPEGVDVLWRWLEETLGASATAYRDHAEREPGGPRLPVRVDLTHPDRPAVVELREGGRSVSFAELAAAVDDVARGLALRGIRPGDRVALLVPPGAELTTLVYAVWRLGAVVVVADAGLGLGRLGGALRSAAPRLVVGIVRALALAATTRVPGERLRVEPGGPELEALALLGRGLGAGRDGAGLPGPDEVAEDADGAVLFTSGATGPPKGVVYTRDQLAAQLAVLRDTFGLAPGERLVAAFAPFALYGPALGMTSAVPDMDVTAPGTLTASALADAVRAVDASVVFAAPAALRNVVATAEGLDAARRAALAGPRLVLSAGAPVPLALLEEVRRLLPAAETQTPYGMTEALPVATLDPTTVGTAEGDVRGGGGKGGVCVGAPVAGVQVGIAGLDALGVPATRPATEPGVVGEILVRGAHVKDRYDRDWARQRASTTPPGWHRTGDVGRLDLHGRLWVEGRLAHVVRGADGPVTPYPVEDRVRGVAGVETAAVVGVGPEGAQQVVVVVVPALRAAAPARLLGAPLGGAVLAPAGVAAAVRRAAAPVPVSAVLVRDWLPVDVRHASKVDRTALADWADGVLHGRSPAGRLRRLLPHGAPRRRSR